MTPSTPPTTLLTLPRELRNEIYTHLFLPAHIYSSYRPKSPYAIERFESEPTHYIDDKLALPTRPPLNLLHTCAQTRHEVLEQYDIQLAQLSASASPNPTTITPTDTTTANTPANTPPPSPYPTI
ncbi:hypothetical protein AOQ84DRAFT_228647, partial [Glonium stellatum]